MSTQSLLLNLEVFAADNNIRRSILSVASNVSGDLTVSSLRETSKILSKLVSGAAVPYVFTSEPGNKITILRVINGTVSVSLTVGTQVLNFIVKDNLFVFPAECSRIELNNSSLLQDAKIHIIQL